MYIINETKLIEIFCKVDDYYQNFEAWQAHLQTQTLQLGKPRRGPQSALNPSEMMSILIFYHLSGFKCFKYYYLRLVLGPLLTYFPSAPSYNRFVELIPRCCLLLRGMVQLPFEAQSTGIYYIDSTKLPVCDIRRASSHRVFKAIARKGKTSTGWFFGLKLHLVVNQLGQIMALHITSANRADNNHEVLTKLLKGLKGKCFGDKGYLSLLFEELLEGGLQLITKIRKNMKNQLVSLQDKQLLNSRTLIETIFDILKHILNIDHTRHRSPNNALTHLLAGLCAYQFLDNKPSIYNNKSVLKFIPKFN